MPNIKVFMRETFIELDEPRAAITNILRRRLQAKGFDFQRVVSRLWSGSYVSRSRRFIYLETPKVASTKIKHLIAELEGVGPNMDRMPYLLETRPTMLIHQRRDLAIPTFLDLTPEESEPLFAGRSDFLFFALVRNPFSRLVSAYENKVRLREPGYSEFGRRWGAVEAGDNVREAFAGFVADGGGLERLIGMNEHHFADQYGGLAPGALPFTRIYRSEGFDEFERAFFDHLRRHGVEQTPSFGEHNRSMGNPWRRYYDAPTAARVAEIFAKDFEIFGYDPDDWRPRDDAPPLITTESEALWRRAVMERNEMLELIYLYAQPSEGHEQAEP